MAVEVILPKVDMDMETGQISRWYAKDGDTVAKGQLLFEIETDKAAMEVDAPASGILADISAAEGTVVPVGQAVAWIYAEGEERHAKSAPIAQETIVAAPIETAIAPAALEKVEPASSHDDQTGQPMMCGQRRLPVGWRGRQALISRLSRVQGRRAACRRRMLKAISASQRCQVLLSLRNLLQETMQSLPLRDSSMSSGCAREKLAVCQLF